MDLRNLSDPKPPEPKPTQSELCGGFASRSHNLIGGSIGSFHCRISDWIDPAKDSPFSSSTPCHDSYCLFNHVVNIHKFGEISLDICMYMCIYIYIYIYILTDLSRSPLELVRSCEFPPCHNATMTHCA